MSKNTILIPFVSKWPRFFQTNVCSLNFWLKKICAEIRMQLVRSPKPMFVKISNEGWTLWLSVGDQCLRWSAPTSCIARATSAWIPRSWSWMIRQDSSFNSVRVGNQLERDHQNHHWSTQFPLFKMQIVLSWWMMVKSMRSVVWPIPSTRSIWECKHKERRNGWKLEKKQI